MLRQQLPSATRPVAWALLSQSLWLPLLAIDLYDRWHNRVESQTPRPGETALQPLLEKEPTRAPSVLSPLDSPVSSKGPKRSSGFLLGARSGVGETLGTRSGFLQRSASSGAGTFALETGSYPAAAGLGSRPGASPATSLLSGNFSRAELLGGPITLADLGQGPIPALALAEQGRRKLSGDPMAALPEAWREPMRQALKGLPTPGGTSARVESARTIHIPSRRVRAATEVPLALQSDGSVDILSRPKEEAVVEEIRDWSARQPPPADGSVAPVVVHLHPLEEAGPVRPPAAPAPEPLLAPPARLADTP
jgi:hypothetical protein